MPNPVHNVVCLNDLGDDLVRLVLTHVGDCRRYIVKLVCKAWTFRFDTQRYKNVTRTPYSIIVSTTMLDWACTQAEFDFDDAARIVLIESMRTGNVALVQELDARGVPLCNHLFGDALSSGNEALLRFAYRKGLHKSSFACEMAAEHGRLDVLQWLREQSCEWDYRTCYKAARGGHRDLLVWAMNNGAFTTDACNGAARGGHFELVRFLNVECGLRIDGWTVFKAAKAGHFDMVKWMVNEQGCEISSSAIEGATAARHTEMVRWMCEHGDEDMDAGIPCAMQIAVGYGNMQALRILLERRQITDDFRRLLCPYAAEGGHVEMLRFLNEGMQHEGMQHEGMQQTVSDARCFLHAAMYGHVSVLEYLRDIECPFDAADAIQYAALRGHVPVLQHFLNRFGKDPLRQGLVREAAINKQKAVLAWLDEYVE